MSRGLGGLAQHLALTLPYAPCDEDAMRPLFESFEGLQCRFMLSVTSEPLSWIRQNIRPGRGFDEDSVRLHPTTFSQALKYVERHRGTVKNVQTDMGDPYVGKSPQKEIEKRTMFDHDSLSQEKHDDVTDSTSTGRPVCGSESTERFVLTPTHVERDQTCTGRPVTVDQKGGTQH